MALAAIHDDRIESMNPATGEILGSTPLMGADQVAAAVRSARDDAAPWAKLSLGARAGHLLRIRGAIVDRAEDLGRIVAAETGKPLPDAIFEVFAWCTLLTYAAKVAPRALRRRTVSTKPMVLKRAWITYEPYGVVGMIAPWNFPLGIPAQVIPSALAAGNTVVFKPSELTPLSGVLLGEVINSAGRRLVHVVTGDGRTGEALVRGGVDKLEFTGSPGTARRILAAAAETLTPVVLELGGKDPMIVSEGADIAKAARAAVGTSFTNSGQFCMAIERVFVTNNAYDRFVEQAVAVTKEIRQGTDNQSNIGSMTRPQQIDVIEKRLADATSKGARILTGGRRKTELGENFFEPTVVVDVDPRMELMREETFGPVLSIMKVESVDEAVRIANDTDYGLNASVFSASAADARRIARRLVAGGVNINDAVIGSGIPALPFGGEKSSGFGRLQGEEGLREFSRTKTITESRLPRGPSIAAAMFTGKRPKPEALLRMMRLMYGSGARERLKALKRRKR
ncbi:MAG TPA: aldehyde dehydrogenase family protein [Actinomycetota bacterium]|nr:aldehyde dehydrogenase family protein [Actinomycetota bacterium]